MEDEEISDNNLDKFVREYVYDNKFDIIELQMTRKKCVLFPEDGYILFCHIDPEMYTAHYLFNGKELKHEVSDIINLDERRKYINYLYYTYIVCRSLKDDVKFKYGWYTSSNIKTVEDLRKLYDETFTKTVDNFNSDLTTFITKYKAKYSEDDLDFTPMYFFNGSPSKSAATLTNT